ncbi:hypothetical protein ACWEVD_01095 [Nocardia thailandica]
MSMLLTTVHDLLAQTVPDPPAKPLPGKLGDRTNDVIGYVKTVCTIAAVLGSLAVAAMLAVGMRGRSDTAKNALTHLPFVFLGVVLTGSTAGLIQVLQ